MTRGIQRILLGILLVQVTVAARADQSGSPQNTPVALDAVVVTAQKPEAAYQTGDVDLEQTPAFFSVITRDVFEGKMETLAEVIEKQAGIQVRSSGGAGSFAFMSIRGSTSEQVMVYLDGVLMNTASEGGVDLSNISLADVQSIEIYRGVTPINFGKASIGGVINIRTLGAGKELGGTLVAGYGSFGTKRLAGKVSHTKGSWEGLVSAEYLAADNDYEFYNDHRTQWTTADDEWETRHNAGFEQVDVLARAGHEFAEGRRLSLQNQTFIKDQALAAVNNQEEARTYFETKRNVTSLRYIADDVTPWHLNTATLVDYTFLDEIFFDNGYAGLGDQDALYSTRRMGAKFFAETFVANHTGSVTLDYHKEYFDARDRQNDRDLTQAERDILNAGIQDNIAFLDYQLIVTPALRYTLIQDRRDLGAASFGQDGTDDDWHKGFLGPQIGMKYAPFKVLTFKANLARYMREPTFFELFGDRGTITGNTDLEPETGFNADLGAEVIWPVNSRWIERAAISATGFYSAVKDRISWIYDARGTGHPENIADSVVAGVELGGSLDFLTYFTLTTNATFQDSENQSDEPAFDGQKLPGIFHQSYLARFEARYRNFKVYGEYIKENDMYYEQANALPAEDKREINAGASVLVKDVLVSLEAKNLFFEHYQTHDSYHYVVQDYLGYPLPGTAVYLTVKYDF